MVFKGGIFERWLGHEIEVLMNDVSDLIKKTLQSSLTLSAMWAHSKKTAVREPGGRLSPDTASVDTLILDLQPPELWKISLFL